MDVDVDINAVLDLHRLNAQSFRGRRSINVFFSLTEPPEANVGDIWVFDESYNDAVFSEELPTDLKPNEVWQKIEKVEYEIDVDKVSKFLQKDDDKFYLSLDTGALIDGVSDGNVKLWDSVPLKAYATTTTVNIPEGSNWESLDAFQWSGSEWMQISFVVLEIYKKGVEYFPLDRVTSLLGNLTKKENYLLLNLNEASELTDKYVLVATVSNIDISSSNKLRVTYEGLNQHGSTNRHTSITISANKDRKSDRKRGDAYTAERVPANNGVEHEIELDVSDLSGEYYVRIYYEKGQSFEINTPSLKIHRVWIE